MPGDPLGYIRDYKYRLRGSAQEIAAFILEHGDDMKDITIRELSERCNVAPSTIKRFCVHIGLSGFKELKHILANNRIVCDSEGVTDEEKEDAAEQLRDIVAELSYSLSRCIKDTRKLLEEGTLQEAIDRLHKAKRIVLFGLGGSMLTALMAYQRFMRATTKLLCPHTYEGQIEIAKVLDDNDVAILFPEARMHKHALELAGQCSYCGAYLIGIAGMVDSPLMGMCDLYYPCQSNNQNMPIMDAMMRCMQDVCIEALCTAYEQSGGDIAR